jgi:Zn finger protein HypA/HybF involved in hydrogenase expression
MIIFPFYFSNAPGVTVAKVLWPIFGAISVVTGIAMLIDGYAKLKNEGLAYREKVDFYRCEKCRARIKDELGALPADCPSCGGPYKHFGECDKCGSELELHEGFNNCPQCGEYFCSITRG